jgi:oligopeptide/dipeptide ABC transporter ATP-binding protein
MYAGRPVEVGTVEEIFYEPAMPYTHGLLGSLPRMDSDGRDRLRQIPGSPPSMIGTRTGCPFAPRCPLRADICDEEEPELRPVTAMAAASDHGAVATDAGTGPGANGDAGTGDGRPAPARDHLSACHFADQVARLPVASMFSDTSADQEGVAP